MHQTPPRQAGTSPSEAGTGADRPARRQDPAPAGPPRALRSEDLLGGSTEVSIRHGKDLYRLRLTSNDKLILTK